jgi:hypothetical protein
MEVEHEVELDAAGVWAFERALEGTMVADGGGIRWFFVVICVITPSSFLLMKKTIHHR